MLCTKNQLLQKSVAIELWQMVQVMGAYKGAVAVILRGIIDRWTSVRVSVFQVVAFIAHAWLEIDGIPSGEEMDLSKFQIIIFVKGGQG